MIDGTYEDGIKDTLKFLIDNGKIEATELAHEEFVELLRQLSGRKLK